MTHNQIEYWKLKEEQRSNQVREMETERSNRATESISKAKQQEEARHNYAVENLSNLTLEENARHNAVSEGETVRSNMAKEALNKYSTDVSASVGFNAANLGLEGTSLVVAESMRHNLETEAYNWEKMERENFIQTVKNQIAAKELTVSESRQKAEAKHQARMDAETERANKVREKQNWFNTGSTVANTVFSGVRTLSDVRANKLKGLTTIMKFIPLVSGVPE